MDIVLFFLKIKRAYNKWRFNKISKNFYQYIDELANSSFAKDPKYAFFYPEIPRMECALSIALRSMGYRIHNDPKQKIDIKIAWEDETWKKGIEKNQELLKNAWNFKCIDISKSFTDEAFNKIFGYTTKVNPEEHKGLLLEKSELNGHHQAKIIQGPVVPKNEFIYQKVINKILFKFIIIIKSKAEI